MGVRQQDMTDEVVQRHIGLVHMVVQQKRALATPGFDLDDMLQEGMIGLVQAARNWDESLGLQFSTYAVPCIEGAVRDAWRRTGQTMRVPGRGPQREAARRTGGDRVLSIDIPPMTANAKASARTNDNKDRPLADALADERAVDPAGAAEAADRLGHLAGAVANLDPTQRAVVMLRYGLTGSAPLSVPQTAARLGITAGSVRSAEARALLHLRGLPTLVV
jgi:RNA polymerase sigma factor for flagellar operon FliA